MLRSGPGLGGGAGGGLLGGRVQLGAGAASQLLDGSLLLLCILAWLGLLCFCARFLFSALPLVLDAVGVRFGGGDGFADRSCALDRLGGGAQLLAGLVPLLLGRVGHLGEEQARGGRGLNGLAGSLEGGAGHGGGL